MKKKNTKQYFDGGNILSLLGSLNNVIPSDTTAGGAAGGAISGAASMATTGNPYLIGAGALLGGIGGGIQGYKQNMNNQINPYTQGVDQRNQMLNIMADGGFLTYYDGGYTHGDKNKDNIYHGIPQGIAPDGRMNTVEPPEAKGIIPSIENFVYSSNPDFIITKDMIKGTNLPNYVVGKVPAEAARMINDKLKDNPNNKIVKETTEILLNQVKDINEVMAMEKNSKNMLKNGGTIQHNQGRYADGGYLSPSQYSQQMQLKDFDPSIPQMQPRIDQLPIPEQKLDTRLNRIPLDFLGTARNLWSIQDQNLLNTPNMPDRSKGISPQMVSAGQQARDYNVNINDYLRDVGRILNKSYIEGDTRPENEIIRDIVGDYDKQPLTTKTFSNGGTIQHKDKPWLQINTPLSQMQQINGFDPLNPTPGVDYSMVHPMMAPESTNNPTNYLNIQDLLAGAKTMGERNQLISQLTNDPNTFAKLGNQGISLGENSVPWQHNQGRYAGGVTEKELWAVNPTLMYKTFPNKKYGEPLSNEEIDLLQSKILADPNLSKQVSLKPNTQMGIDWLTAMGRLANNDGGDNPPPGIDIPDGSVTSYRFPDIPITDNPRISIPPVTTSTGTPGKRIDVPNLWSEFIAGAGLLSEGLNPILANPTIRSLGYVKAPKSDLMTQDKLLQEQYNTGGGGLASASNGSIGGLRDNILALNYNIGLDRSNAYANAEAKDAQMKLQTDMYNNEAQDRVGADIMQGLNNFDLENTELRNNYQLKKMDDRISNLKEYGQNRFNIDEAKRLENARRRDIEYFTGYKIPDSRKTIQITPDTYSTKTIPGFSTSLPGAKLNAPTMQYNSGVNDPIAKLMKDDLSKQLEGSRLNGINGYQQPFPGIFDPYQIQRTIDNKTIKKPEFKYGGTIKRSLK